MTFSAILPCYWRPLGVLGTGTGWPDVIVATIMAGLALQGAWVVLRQSRSELQISSLPA